MFVYDHVRVVRLDDIFNPTYGSPVGSREAYFTKDFPSSGDISHFLLDTTLVVSEPPRGNEVFYFDKDHNLVLWRDNIVQGGEWRSSSELQILKLGKERRFAIVQTFCILFLGPVASPQIDNCYSVADVDSLLPRRPEARKERVAGNIFNLAPGKSPPFNLPRSEISVASLLQSMQDKRR